LAARITDRPRRAVAGVGTAIVIVDVAAAILLLPPVMNVGLEIAGSAAILGVPPEVARRASELSVQELLVGPGTFTEFGAVRAPNDWVLPSLFLGVVIGGGLAVSGLLASRLVREGRPWRAAVLGAGTEVVMVFAAILAAGAVLMGPGCQRPPV